MTKSNTNFDFENSVVFLIILNQEFLIFIEVFAQNQDYSMTTSTKYPSIFN